ncbi:MAG: CPBP family intramembrane metalloprotease [Proteobacteria bacterium]|nr:CPBP family intramembrane metalloprotease [Pseudomonadota bacterium]
MNHRILAVIAVLSAILLCLLAGSRDDHEVTALSTDHAVSLSLPSDSSASLFLCLPSMTDIPAETYINGERYDVEPPRPLTLSAKTAEQFDVSPHLACGAVWLEIPPAQEAASGSSASIALFPASAQADVSEQTFEIRDLPSPTLVIAASSRHAGWFSLLILFITFLGTLWGAAACASYKPYPFSKPVFKPYDAVTSFLAAMGLSLVLSMPFAQNLDAPESHILPSFLDFLPVLSVNFVAMLTVAGAFLWYRSRRTAPAVMPAEEADKETPPPSESAPAPAFNPLLSLGLGFGLAVTAALVLNLLSPTVELGTIEMATQLTSSCYLTCIFAILAGVSEECLFRGIIQTSLEAKSGSKHPIATNILAIAISSVLFVGVHIPQSIEHLWALLPIALVSLTCGYLKLRYRSLFPSILLHMTYNTILLVPSLLQLFLFLG